MVVVIKKELYNYTARSHSITGVIAGIIAYNEAAIMARRTTSQGLALQVQVGYEHDFLTYLVRNDQLIECQAED